MQKKETKYPQFLPTHPTGKDLLDGKSQEKVGNAIGQHITEVDDQDNDSMSRVIGIEGVWGSGKSNVISYLKNSVLDKDKYVFFEYDAWSHQEDLQRRSIIHLLTDQLVENEILSGTIKANMPKVEKDGNISFEERDVTWKERLQMLMAKKVSTFSKTSKVVYPEFKLFVLFLAITPALATLGNVLKPTFTSCFTYWTWLCCVIGFFALLYSSLFAIIWFHKKWKVKNVWKVYADSSSEEKNSYQVVNSAEPSLIEFSTWMEEVSKGLNGKKVIAVFDNMDRLPKEKVKQLWSAIHTLFSNDKLRNIWCIIPYDFKHLATAFGEDVEESEKLAKYFIEKSFPVVYRVPAPVILDYKKIFDQFFSEAFGKTVDVVEQDKINRCYRLVNPKPNIREIITFINKLVALRKTYTSMSIISIALFVLKENSLLNKPIVQENVGGDILDIEISTDEYLLRYEFLNGLSSVINKDTTLLKEVAGIVYGIEPNRAYQLSIRQALMGSFTDASSASDLNLYSSNDLFFPMLFEVLKELEYKFYPIVAKRLDTLKDEGLTDNQKMELKRAWNNLGDKYIELKIIGDSYSDYESALMRHVDDSKARKIANVFTTMYSSDEAVEGNKLYTQLTLLFNEDFAQDWNKYEIMPQTSIEPQNFVKYVEEAGGLYKQFPISCNADELNAFFKEHITDDVDYSTALSILATDGDYSIKVVSDYASEAFATEKADLHIAVRLLNLVQLFHDSCDVTPSQGYAEKLWDEARKIGAITDDYKQVYLMMCFCHPDLMSTYDAIDGKEIGELAIKFASNEKIINHYCTRHSHDALKHLITSIFKNRLADESEMDDFVCKWDVIKRNNEYLTYEDIFDFAEAWHYYHIHDVEIEKTIKELLPTEDWLDALFNCEATICDDLISKLAEEIKAEDPTYFNSNIQYTGSKPYWYKAFCLLNSRGVCLTPYGEQLDKLVIKALKWLASGNVIKDSNVITLLERAEKKTVSSEMNDITRSMLISTTQYKITPATFPILHSWLEHSELNNAGYQLNAADMILSKVVDDSKCRSIILENKEYYQPIIQNTQETSSNLHNKLKALIKTNPDDAFSKFVQTITNYESSSE